MYRITLSFILFSISFVSLYAQTTVSLLNSYSVDEDVPEPSGLAYDKVNNQLFTVSDTKDIFRLSITGDLLEIYDFEGDLEGITMYNSPNTLLVAIEDQYELVEYNYVTGSTTTHEMDYENREDPAGGIEGVTYNPTTDEVYFVNEKEPNALIIANSNFDVTNEYVLDFSGDLSALYYVEETNNLWMGSDNSSSVYKCDIEGNVLQSFELTQDGNEDGDQLAKLEGIAIDYGNQLLYVITDEGKMLYVYGLSTPSTTDCNGVLDGTASIDDCDICSGGNTGIAVNSSCIQDCNGTYNGTASIDNCNVCSGGDTGIEIDDCSEDCNGVFGGTASIDDCEICSGGNTGIAINSTCEIDCNGIFNGTASIDNCDVCSGGNTGIEADACLECNQPFATHEDGINVAANILENLDTRWSGNGVGVYNEICLGDTISIETISIAFYIGDERSTFFNIDVSLDGINWTRVLQDQESSGSTRDQEDYMLPNVTDAWKLRFVGGGNSGGSEWNSVTKLTWSGLVTGTKETLTSTINVFPNPVLDQLYITGLTSNITWNVVNMQGQTITSGSKDLINTSELESGIYLLMLSNGEAIKFLK